MFSFSCARAALARGGRAAWFVRIPGMPCSSPLSHERTRERPGIAPTKVVWRRAAKGSVSGTVRKTAAIRNVHQPHGVSGAALLEEGSEIFAAGAALLLGLGRT